MLNVKPKSIRYVAAAIIALYLAMTPWTSLWDRDEPRFAQATVEMMASGHYLYPTLGGDVRAQKPILIYWLMALSMSLFGVTELGARFWAPIAMGATALATWFIARRIASARAGLLAMLIVVLNPLAMVEGSAATPDAVLLALVTIALAAFVSLLTGRQSIATLTVFAVTCGAAMLAKGPVGLMPIAVAAGTVWSLRRDSSVRRIALPLSIAAAAGVTLFLAWAVPANMATGGRFVTQGVHHDIVARIMVPLEGHGGNPLVWLPFYPLVVLLGFAPWSAGLPAVARLWYRGEQMSDSARTLFVWWIAVPLAAFSAASTHLPHYILPMWPALAIGTAVMFDKALDGAVDAGSTRWMRRGWPIALVWAMVLGATMLGPHVLFGVPGVLSRGAPLIALVLAASAAFIHFIRQPRSEKILVVTLCLIAVTQFAVAGLWLPSLEREKPVPRLATLIRAQMRAPLDIATIGFAEPSLDFYTGTATTPISTPEQLQKWMRAPGRAVLVTTRSVMSSVDSLTPLREIGSARGINVASGQRIELVALERTRALSGVEGR